MKSKYTFTILVLVVIYTFFNYPSFADVQINSNPPKPSQQTLDEIRLEAVGLFDGTSGKVDEKRAGELFLEAANKGDLLARFWVGILFYFGACGFEAQQLSAAIIIESAYDEVLLLANSNHSEAQVLMGVVHSLNLHLPTDLKQATSWMSKAAHLGNSSGMIFLGHNALKIGNYKDAIHWFKQAEKIGHPGATTAFGEMYLNGTGFEQDYAKAAKYFQKSAHIGEYQAMVFLGDMHQEGLNFQKNPDKAYKWYLKAQKAGSKEAIIKLKEFNDTR